MLAYDPKERITAEEALKHPYLLSVEGNTNPIDQTSTLPSSSASATTLKDTKNQGAIAVSSSVDGTGIGLSAAIASQQQPMDVDDQTETDDGDGKTKRPNSAPYSSKPSLTAKLRHTVQENTMTSDGSSNNLLNVHA